MSRPRTWSALVPGMLALAILGGLGAAVLIFARVGALHGRTMRIYATVTDARGLSAGSDVWLGGRKVGVVDAVTFAPPSTDTTRRLLLSLRVLAEHRPQIRQGATVELHPGGNLIGAPIVAIGFGDPATRPVADGDTLRAAQSAADIDHVRAEFATATAQLPAVIGSVKILGAQLRAARGTLGAFGIDGGKQLARVQHSASVAMRAATARRGTLGRALSGDLRSHANQAMAAADSIRVLLSGTDRTSLGRFRRDSTLLGTIDAVRTDLAEVAQLLESPRGSIGRVQSDSALAMEVARTRVSLASLISDIQRNPLRYISF